MGNVKPSLLAAVVGLSHDIPVGTPTSGYTGAVVQRVAGPLKTTLTLLEYGGERVCLLASHFGTSCDDATVTLQAVLSDELGMAQDRVLVFSSHNHSVPLLEKHAIPGWEAKPPPSDLTPLGKRFIRDVRVAARRLAGSLEPVSVWWGQGAEGRITYNRKGRRADGSTYLMREEDRQLLGADFRGDIDQEAPVVCLRGRDGRPVTFIVQFTGHPVTTYHAEKPTVYGDWPQVACDLLAVRCGGGSGGPPVSFLQGCAGEINSKHMFSGDVALANRYGRCLGQAYVKAARSLRPSQRPGLDYAVATARVPFARLPAPRVLERELAEMKDFVRRARAGDEDTRSCVGLNFPRALSPAYRGRLIEYVIPWNRWALDLHRRGKASSAPKSLELKVYVLRLGDVGFIGLPCEPFMGIGRLIRRGSPLPLAVPCGYVNSASGFVGYIPDAPNTGDREYQSAFYRYTRFCPPFRKPAGDVLAHVGLAALRRFARGPSES